MPSTATAKELPATLNLQAVQGDDWRFLLLLGPQTYASYAEFLSLANGFDVSGWTLAAEARRSPKDATAIVAFAFDLTQQALGAVALVAAADQTDPIVPGNYVWDMEAIIAGKERTLLAGQLVVKPKVTR